jgi:hypothetical protein
VQLPFLLASTVGSRLALHHGNFFYKGLLGESLSIGSTPTRCRKQPLLRLNQGKPYGLGRKTCYEKGNSVAKPFLFWGDSCQAGSEGGVSFVAETSTTEPQDVG